LHLPPRSQKPLTRERTDAAWAKETHKKAFVINDNRNIVKM